MPRSVSNPDSPPPSLNVIAGFRSLMKTSFVDSSLRHRYTASPRVSAHVSRCLVRLYIYFAVMRGKCPNICCFPVNAGYNYLAGFKVHWGL